MWLAQMQEQYFIEIDNFFWIMQKQTQNILYNTCTTSA